MTDFTSIMSNIELATSNYDVRNNKSGNYKNITCTDLLANLKAVRIGIKEGSHFLRTSLNKDVTGLCLTRSDQHTNSAASVLILDCDKRLTNGKEFDGAPDPQKISEILRANNIAHVLYGSYSHYLRNIGNRFRIILLSKNPYTKQQLAPTIEKLIFLINSSLEDELLVNVTENSTWSQPWYFPRKPANCIIDDLHLEYLEGEAVEISDPIVLPHASHTFKHLISFKPGEISPIQAFNEQYNLNDFLEQHGFKRKIIAKEYEKWLSPNSTSGKAGITVKDGKFFSHHGDEFNDGYWHDTFDLMRIKEGLSINEAVIKAAQNTLASDGRTIDEHNKNLASNRTTPEPSLTPEIIFEKYRPFNDDLLPVENIPYEALPETMAGYIKEHSLIRGCPPDYILVSLLARLGCVFAGKLKIALTRNTNWCASPNFFWMMVGNPSSGKSNAFSLTNKPIQALEDNARKTYKEEFRSYKDNHDILERKLNAAYKGLEHESKSKNSNPNTIAKFEESIKKLKAEIYQLGDQKPKLKRYTIQKLTIEKLILILEDNPEGIMLEVDELSSVFIRLSKDENGDERALYLSGYNGNISFSYDTIKRGTVIIPNLLLSILGGTQPSKLKRFLNEAKSGQQDDGLLQRFQGVVYPDRNVLLPVDRKDNEALSVALGKIFHNLDNLSSSLSDNDTNILRFHEDAQTIFDEWREEKTKETLELNYPIDAHVGKSYEFVAALSAYIYLYENNGHLTDDKKISKRHILSAIKLGKYFLSHAKRIYGLAYQDDMPARSLSEKLAKLCSVKNISEHYDTNLKSYFFTRSQIRVKGWAELNTKEQRIEAIETLITRGIISKQLNGRYYINPKHLTDS